jgi:transcriptional regulator with XRE-family HTH domain
LRAVRAEQHLSLHGVQRRSLGRWKAVVVGSYERGDRAISVQRLAELASFYDVPITDLLPHEGESGPGQTRVPSPTLTKITINLKRLRASDNQDVLPLRRLVERVQSQRSDRSSATVVLRRSDVEMLAIYYDTNLAGMTERLVRWHVLAPHSLILDGEP